jgi:hypothetical protein
MARADRGTKNTSPGGESNAGMPSPLESSPGADPIEAVRAAVAAKRASALNPDAPTIVRICESLEAALVELSGQRALLDFEVDRQKAVHDGRAKREAAELREKQERAATAHARKVLEAKRKREAEDRLIAEAAALAAQENHS